MINTITVTQLNTYVKSLIENDSRLAIIAVSGEISNFKNHYSSGHWYFTLKDKSSSVRCVMFKGNAARAKFVPQDGMAVIIKGKVSLYEKDGQYQLYAEEIHTVGDGDLALAFKQVKEKLEAEGLFDSQSKRALVKYPKRIAVVTSDTGAAVKDILNITSKRYPQCEVVICPVSVQGDSAAKDMIMTLDRLYLLDNIDTIIIGRGGGSAEDLHCFNDEDLARKIYESPYPVISAVGHETDFTICDFVADVRASTPSHAAELAVPDKNDLKNRVLQLSNIIKNRTEIKLHLAESLYSSVKNRSVLNAPQKLFEKKQLSLDSLSDRMLLTFKSKYKDAEHCAENVFMRIDALSPLKTMLRGFLPVVKNGRQLKSACENSPGDNIKIYYADGQVDCTVTAVEEKTYDFK